MAVTNQLTLVGNVATDVTLQHTSSGIPVLHFRLAVSRRVLAKQDGEEHWEDRLDGFFTVNCWRRLAEHAAASLKKGDRVVVHGRLVNRSWTDADNRPRWSTEIEAEEVAAALKFSSWTRRDRSAPIDSDDPGPTEPPETGPTDDDERLPVAAAA